MFFCSIILITNCAKDNAILVHVVANMGSSDTPMSQEKMTGRLINDATEYEQFAPIPRMALYDMAFGAHVVEHAQLGQKGVLQVTSANQDKDELPIKKIYVQIGDRSYELEHIKTIQINNSSTLVKKVFGISRNDSFFLIPYELANRNGKIMIDWQINREKFVLLDNFQLEPISNEIPLEFLQNMSKEDLPNAKNTETDKNILNKFLLRKFGIKN